MNITTGLKPLATGLWIVETPFSVLGLEFGNRMTVLRLKNGGLWLHSPVRLSDEIRGACEQLGKVAYLVAPNCMHNLYVGQWQALYPDAVTYAPEGIKKVAADVSLQAGMTVPDAWRGEVSVFAIGGLPRFNEFVFYHVASKSLIVTDLAFNLGGEVSWWSRLVFKLYGVYDRFGPSLLVKTMIKDKAAFKASMDEILALDFERVIVSHGHIVEHDAHARFRDAFAVLS